MAPESTERESRTLFTLLIIAGSIGLAGGTLELLLFGQFGPGPYFTVSLSTAVLLVTLLFVRTTPSPLTGNPAPSASPTAGPEDLPNPLSTPGQNPLSDAFLARGDGWADEKTALTASFSARARPEAAVASTAPELTLERRPWQAQPLPVPLGGGFLVPRTSEGVLASLDRLAEELARPVPGVRAPPTEESPEPSEPAPPATHVIEDVLVHPHLGRGSTSSPRAPEGSRTELPPPRLLHLPTEKELLQGLPPESFPSPSRPASELKPVTASELPMGMEQIRSELEKLRHAFLSGPKRSGPPARRPSPPPAHSTPSPATSPARPAPRAPQPLTTKAGRDQARVSEGDLQLLLDDLEFRLKAPLPLAPRGGPSPVTRERTPTT